MKRIAILLSLLFLSCVSLFAQDETFYKEADVIRFDKKVHDFGDVLIAEGPVTCLFTFTNIGSQPIVVHNVISSCGCTTPEWTREPVRPGATGTIQATFSNDQGPYPFEKTLTVYVGVGRSSLERPVILRLRGVSHEKKKDLDEIFTTKIGSLGLRKTEVSIGYIDQGVVKSDQMQVANLSKSDLTVETATATPGLTITVTPNPVPARSMARLTYAVNPAAMGATAWGKQRFEATFRLNGREQTDKVTITGVIKDNFEKLSKADIEKAGLYNSPNQVQNFCKCVETREPTISPAEVGGRSGTLCLLCNMSYQYDTGFDWDPAKMTFANGTGRGISLKREGDCNGWEVVV